MDNITHTLISALVGVAIHRSTWAAPDLGPDLEPNPRSNLSEKAHRNVAVGVMVVGGNLPDIDVIHTTLAGGTLDYLLNHRGHTHTLVGSVIISVLLFVAVRLWWRYRKAEPSPADVRVLVALVVLAPLLHIALDLTNSYGVHPFWPVDNHWYYGDAVFIVEPLLWACAAPLLFTLRNAVARGLVGLVLVVGVGLSWGSGLVPAPFAALVTLLTVGLAVAARTSARAALAGGIASWLALTAVFLVTSRTADARIDAVLASAFPAERTLDTVLTPMPANPVCHEVLTVALTDGRYVVRSGIHSVLPAWLPAGDCAQRSLPGTPTAPLVPVAQPSTDALVWAGELSLPRDLPATLAQDYCAVSALMQFARVPWAAPQGDGWLVGDLRYDREPEAGFAEIAVGPATDDCPAYRPPWVPPREDVLDGG